MLLILLVALFAIFALVLWGGSVFLQGWLYNDLARQLPLRAVAGGAILALFHVGWCAIYKIDPGRFDTLYSFKTEMLDGKYDEFESIRKVGKKEQKPLKYIRRGEKNEFESLDNHKIWNRSDADGMVVAVLIHEKGNKDPTRFDANMTADGRFRAPEDSRYEADGGRKYMDVNAMGKVYRKRSMPILGNLFANFLHLAVWIVVLWPVMRFTLGHAVGIGLALWGITMLLQPALFEFATK